MRAALHGDAASSTGYTSARLNTEGKAAWTYGRMEGALMMPDGIGTWPALWMLPTDWAYGGWPDSGEIDIMEHVGCDANEIVGTVHTGAYNHMIGTQQGGDLMWSTATSNLHVYAIDWSPDQIHFSLDGLRYFTFENDGVGDPATWPFDQRFHFVLNLAVGGSWGGYCGLDASAFPALTNANIYAPTMMLAEKAADLLTGDTPLAPEVLPFYRADTDA